jgi:enamine deaminase RidA (YjgF/YER057c/UK114 family)
VATKTINPWQWQERFGFSQAVEVTGADRVLYLAGQASVDETGAPQHAGDMGGQIGQTFDNLERVLSEASMSLENVVRLHYFTTDMEAYFGAMETVMSRLGSHRPASTLVAVTRLALPELLVEIEATAVG